MNPSEAANGPVADTPPDNNAPHQDGPAQNQAARRPPVWADPSPEELVSIKNDVRVLWERLIPAYLQSMVSPAIDEPAAALIYLHRFVADAGDPKDPVLRALLEQMAFAHLRLARLNAETARAQAPEAYKIFSGAAVRLLSEVRKLALAIKAYQQPPLAKSFAVIQQQNISREQQVSYTQQTGPEAKETLICRDTKVGSNGAPDDDNIDDILRSRGCRAAKPPAAEAAD